jgi:hypothetical protein
MAVIALPAFGVANGFSSCQGYGYSNQTAPGAAGKWHSCLGPRPLHETTQTDR